MLIRNAVRSDAARLARVAEETFRATFGSVNRAEDMALHCRRSYGEALQAAEIADSRRTTLLAEHTGDLIGYAQMRWGEAPACVVAQRPARFCGCTCSLTGMAAVSRRR